MNSVQRCPPDRGRFVEPDRIDSHFETNPRWATFAEGDRGNARQSRRSRIEIEDFQLPYPLETFETWRARIWINGRESKPTRTQADRP